MHSLLFTKISLIVKAIGVLIITWFTEIFIENAISVSIINPRVKEFFVDTKPIINWIVSVLVLIFTIYKFKKEKK